MSSRGIRRRFGGRFELVIRTAGAPASLAPAVRALVHERAARGGDRDGAAVAARRRVGRSAAVRDDGARRRSRCSRSRWRRSASTACCRTACRSGGASWASARRSARRDADLVRLVIREGLGATTIGLALGLAAAARSDPADAERAVRRRAARSRRVRGGAADPDPDRRRRLPAPRGQSRANGSDRGAAQRVAAESARGHGRADRADGITLEEWKTRSVCRGERVSKVRAEMRAAGLI